MSDYQLHNVDCLEFMRSLPDKSIDAIITDLPYGTTACSWDEIIPFDPMWEQVNRINKGVFVTTASQPFTSKLIMSNIENFKYEWIWEKDRATGHLDAENKPMRKHENIVLFGRGVYNPVITRKPAENIRPVSRRAASDNYGKYNESAERGIPLNMAYPQSVLKINTANNDERGHHPTQKPIKLFEYLIRTYTNAGDTVLDFTMGSGTTGVACMLTGRNFIGCDNDTEHGYFQIAEKRIRHASQQMIMEFQ